jgi:hypothetical protein
MSDFIAAAEGDSEVGRPLAVAKVKCRKGSPSNGFRSRCGIEDVFFPADEYTKRAAYLVICISHE